MPDTTLVKKLGIRPGFQVAILDAPTGYREQLGELPAGVTLTDTAVGIYDVVQVFVTQRADLEQHAPQAMQALKPDGVLWFTYPKQSAKVPTDITRDVGWDVLRQAGLRPVTQIAIDAIWSALRFRPEPATA